MKIVVLDGYTENPGDLSWAPLGELGELTVYDRTNNDSEEEIIKRITNANIVLTNKTPISAATISASKTLQYIGVLATGYNVVDTNAAKNANVIVCNIPTYGTAAVGQFAIALLLEICHHIGHHNDAVHEGRWENNVDWCFWDFPLIELSGKTMGIIGYGRIGQTTGGIAQALGMNVLVHDNYVNANLISDTCQYVDLDTLYAQSDVISLHCPLFPETTGIINSSSIAKMKDGVILLNNSRGPLLVEQDVADALKRGKILAAGIDVTSTEPINSDNPLLSAPNCIITPHISWAPKESRQRLMDIAVENVKQFLKGTPQNVVNS